jgi:hypothetical protein
LTPGVTLPAYDGFVERGAASPEEEAMCMNCGCMRAHDDMGNPEVNITYETIKRAADGNKMTVQQVLENIQKTAQKDRGEHPQEWAA